MTPMTAKIFSLILYTPGRDDKEAAYATAARYLSAPERKKLRKSMGLDTAGVTKAEALTILKNAIAEIERAMPSKGIKPVKSASKGRASRKLRSEAKIAKDRESIFKAIAAAQTKFGFATTGNVKGQVKSPNFANDLAAMLKEGLVTTKPITADERKKLEGVAAAKTKSTLHIEKK